MPVIIKYGKAPLICLEEEAYRLDEGVVGLTAANELRMTSVASIATMLSYRSSLGIPPTDNAA